MTPSNPPEDWAKEFEDKFDLNHFTYNGQLEYDLVVEVKKFISSLISKVREEERERAAKIAEEYLQGQFLDKNGKDPEGVEEYERDVKMVNQIVKAIAKSIREDL